MRLIKILYGTLSIILLGVLFVACQEDDFSQCKLICINGKYPAQSGTNLAISYSDSGRLSYQIFTPELNKYDGEESYMDCPKGIKIISYDAMGKEEAIMTADYAISNDMTMEMEARNNIVITNIKKGDTIFTEKIVWNKRERRIYSDVPVRMIRSDGTVNRGSGFDADERFTKYTVRNPQGEILTDEL